jgi:hypothetical protein
MFLLKPDELPSTQHPSILDAPPSDTPPANLNRRFHTNRIFRFHLIRRAIATSAWRLRFHVLRARLRSNVDGQMQPIRLKSLSVTTAGVVACSLLRHQTVRICICDAGRWGWLRNRWGCCSCGGVIVPRRTCFVGLVGRRLHMWEREIVDRTSAFS